MKILTNPSKQDVRIRFKGLDYEIPANGKLAVSEELSAFWLNVHAFLQVNDEQVKLPEVPVAKPVPVVVEEKKTSKKSK